jgi:hypothetical protein
MTMLQEGRAEPVHVLLLPSKLAAGAQEDEKVL